MSRFSLVKCKAMLKLEATKPECCTGCGLCIIYASTLLTDAPSLSNSPIKVVRTLEKPEEFSVQVDEAKKHELLAINEVCPEGVFEIVSDDNDK